VKMTAEQPEQDRVEPSAPAKDFAATSLLMTIGVAPGPLALEPDMATALGDRAGDSGADIQDDAAARVPDLLNRVCKAYTLRFISAACGDDPVLLSRCDFVVPTEAAWRVAGKFVRGRSATMRALLGVSHWISLGEASMEVSTASRRLPAAPVTPAPGLRSRTFTLAAGQSVFLARGTRFRPGKGAWLGLDYVRAWMKPDILFASALPRSVLDTLDPALSGMIGTTVSLPVSVDTFVEAEAAAARGELANVSGRGV